MLSRDDVFSELGIGPVWRLRETPATFDAPGTFEAPARADTWEQLANSVARCSGCKLAATRNRDVFGCGDRNADWLIVGEAPGADEDAQGEPFVGEAGRLLDAMLASIGLDRRRNVYITNVLKSHPPGNRHPEPDEIAACLPYLLSQIELLQPKIILALGGVAAHALLQTDEPVGHLRGRVHQYRSIPLVVTYHPAYLLRRLTDKARAWEDLCLARRTRISLTPEP